MPKTSIVETAAVYCHAPVNYVARSGVGETVEPMTVAIIDGRRAALPEWQVCGFELMRHVSMLAGWDDDAAIERVHYPEISAFAQSLSG